MIDEATCIVTLCMLVIAMLPNITFILYYTEDLVSCTPVLSRYEANLCYVQLNDFKRVY